jgi:ABC-type sulfate/molybdate transport systems ATPase subunit
VRVLNADVEVERREFTVRARVRVAPGERVALFGPSGAGKTTVLEAVAGLVPLARGTVELGDRTLSGPGLSVPGWQRRVGLLRQDPGLFPHLSVRANLLYARTARLTEVGALADALGIGELLPEMPVQLSGGQRHRVALGRLLLAHCDTLLLDEPFASLDAPLRRSLTALVRSLVTERSLPSVLVTHQLADAQAFADRLLIMDRGAVLQEGPPSEVVLRPASRRVAELVGYLGFVPLPVPSAAVAGVHPERVIAGAAPERGITMTAGLVTARPSGAGWEADLVYSDALFTCWLPARPEGSSAVVTLLDPPCFGPDGEALPAREPRWLNPGG